VSCWSINECTELKNPNLAPNQKKKKNQKYA
jgi:hypothetical protein